MKRLLTFLVIITCFNATNNAQNAATISDSIFSKTLNEHRQFWVQLPENYNLDSKINYPVLYVLDGFSLKSTLENS